MIPLSETQSGANGQVNHLRICKGQMIYIPIATIQRDPTLWGDDSAEFRPNRFLEPERPALKDNTRYTLWSHLLVFGGGTRSCIGYKFAIMEMKALLARLIIDHDFAPTGDACKFNAWLHLVVNRSSNHIASLAIDSSPACRRAGVTRQSDASAPYSAGLCCSLGGEIPILVGGRSIGKVIIR